MTIYSERAIAQMKTVSTATLTTVLLKKGLRNVWIRGAYAMHRSIERKVGPAFTLRFLPAREDLATPASWSSPRSTRAAIEEMPHGCIAVAEARGCADAGILGDILCARMRVRGVEALVTDGVLRDSEGVARSRLAVWSAGTAAPPAVTSLTFVDWQQPVGCGGVAVFPADIIVADADGAVVVPKDEVNAVLDAALEQERLEGWIMNEVEAGARLPGLYPPDDVNRARYERYKAGEC